MWRVYMNFDLFGSIYQSMNTHSDGRLNLLIFSACPSSAFHFIFQAPKKKKSATVSAPRPISAVSPHISAYDYIVLHIPLHNRDTMLNIGEDYRDNGGGICGPEY